MSGRAVIVVGLFALFTTACGAAASDTETSGTSGNACTVDTDCGDGRCLSGFCAAKNNTIGFVMVEISPPVGVGSGEYGNTRYLLARKIDTERRLDFELDVVADLSIAVSAPEGGCTATSLDGEGLVPISLKAATDSGIHGLADSTIDASSALAIGGGAIGNAVSLALAPGQVDLYIVPLAEGSTADGAAESDGRCDLAPLLARGQTISPGVVSMKQPLPLAEHMNIDVTVPVGADGQSPLDGWFLEMVEPLGGRRLSARVSLNQTSLGEDGKFHHKIRLAYHSIIGLDADKLKGKELIRLTPPAGTLAPTYYVARSAMDLFGASNVVLSQITSLPSTVVVSGLVESAVDGTPLRADIVATLDPGEVTSTGALASFQLTTTSDSKGKFELQLPAGKYKVLATPSASVPYASRAMEWTVAANPALQAGKLIQVGPLSQLTGIAYSALHRQSLAGVTLSASPSTAGKRPTFLDELLGHGEAVGVRSQMVVADERGAFQIPVDEGRYDIAVRPAEGTGYPWGVYPSVDIGSETTKLLSIELRNPVAYVGRVTTRGRNAGASTGGLPGALLRFYALFDDNGQLAASPVSAVSGVEIGHVRTDESGTYKLLLPEGLD